jgi:small subunit ribosomal protein S9
MTEDPNKDEISESQETETDEGPDRSPAGPLTDDGAALEAEGQSLTPPSPADEVPEDSSEEAEVEEPEILEEEEEEEEVGVAVAEPSQKAPESSEKKKADVIPGADLEPIAVEPEAAPLSAEEQARLEAEEEERARREAELAGETEEPEAASRAPAKMESGARYLATGKRKNAIARVTLTPGEGKFEVNKRALEEFFPRPLHQTMARQPLVTTGYEGNVDVRVLVHGGGVSGQAGAVRHGIARALTEIDAELRGDLKRRGFLTRDARVKERRKAGLKKARKRPQFSKR